MFAVHCWVDPEGSCLLCLFIAGVILGGGGGLASCLLFIAGVIPRGIASCLLFSVHCRGDPEGSCLLFAVHY